MRKNRVFRSYIGMGYHDCIVPPVIQRNVLENPGWYTQYTPYQAEIAQGRLEALLNFQTMVIDLTGPARSPTPRCWTRAPPPPRRWPWRTPSRGGDGRENTLLRLRALPPADHRGGPHPRRRARHRVVVGDHETFDFSDPRLRRAPAVPRHRRPRRRLPPSPSARARRRAVVVAAADLLSLTLLTPPGEWGADIAVGTTQRFGVPMGYGGPHAAYFACRDEHKRLIPAASSASRVDAAGTPRCAWRCRRASSTSAARRPPPTSAPRRCCWR
jgi:glycine dehydrogenase